MTATASSNYTTFVENGEVVYPCRCGKTHRGDYAIYDYGHHNCFHTAELVDIGNPEISGYFMCPQCGKTFNVAGGSDG